MDRPLPDDGRPDVYQRGPLTEKDAHYAEEVGERSEGAIGDTYAGTGTLKPTDDIGTGGPEDVAGARDFDDTSIVRDRNIGEGGILGTRLGDVGPQTGAAGPTQAERGGLSTLAGQSASPPIERGPADRAPEARAEERVDTDQAGSLNASAVQAAGFPRPPLGGKDELPGTADLGAAGGRDLARGLGATRGNAQPNPPGEITGVGGTRGSGEGTGHPEDTLR